MPLSVPPTSDHSHQAFFLDIDAVGGRRFAIYHPSRLKAPRGQVIYVHPLADEMNKARRMAAMQSRALAAAGYAVLQVDLFGCGDSEGDFGDATWERWSDDLVAGAQWLAARVRRDHGGACPPLWLWGLRAGCLLAGHVAQRMPSPPNLLFWQPMASGKLVLHQFLRLRAAAEMLGGGGKGVLEALKLQLASGRAVDVAGYELSPSLARALGKAALMASGDRRAAVLLEVSATAEDGPSPATKSAAEVFSQAGWTVSSEVVHGPMFWQTTEIEDAPALVAATLRCLDKLHSDGVPE